ncbi:hypothetical protein V7306_03850 [Neobacillus vireti]
MELLEFISNDHVELLGMDMSDYQDPYLKTLIDTINYISLWIA